jgi:uncharacterized protein (DUF433 family)
MTRVNPHVYPDPREVPKYSVTEVALYFNLKPRTVHTWFFGRSYKAQGKKRFWEPLAIPAAHDPHGYSLSFYNLAEAHVLSSTRHDFNISMKSIRFAMKELGKIYPQVSHPLLSKNFETDGCDLFIRVLREHGEELIVNLTTGNYGLKVILDAYLKRIIRDTLGFPTEIFPVIDHDFADRTIVINPGVAAGRPTIASVGVRASAVWERYRAGETTHELAEDYGINETEIKKAINYFTTTAKAA